MWLIPLALLALAEPGSGELPAEVGAALAASTGPEAAPTGNSQKRTVRKSATKLRAGRKATSARKRPSNLGRRASTRPSTTSRRARDQIAGEIAASQQSSRNPAMREPAAPESAKRGASAPDGAKRGARRDPGATEPAGRAPATRTGATPDGPAGAEAHAHAAETRALAAAATEAGAFGASEGGDLAAPSPAFEGDSPADPSDLGEGFGTGDTGADTSFGADDSESDVRFDVHGFASSAWVSVKNARSGGTSLLSVPEKARGALELNVQPSLNLGDTLVFSADASLFLGTERETLVLLNEIATDLRLPSVRLLAGRRRLLFGSAIGLNPADLINPPKDLLDPEAQRAGAFLLPMIDVSIAGVTFSAAISPAFEVDRRSLPSELDFRRALLFGRAFATVLATDATLVLYRDIGRGLTHAGGSLSRFVLDDLELHAEALISERTDGALAELGGLCTGDPREGVSWSLAAGGRYEWSDQTFIAGELLHRGEGLTGDELSAVKATPACAAAAALAVGSAAERTPVGRPSDLPVLLLRQNYLLLLFQRPHLAAGALDDVSIRALALADLADGSTIVQLRIAYDLSGVASIAASGSLWLAPDSGALALALSTRAAAGAEVRVSY